MKLDKWDVLIGVIMGGWVISQILRLLVIYTRFDAWSIGWEIAFLSLLLLSSLGIGVLFLLGSAVVLLVRAFQTSKLWGLAVLFIPFAAPVFIFKHWDESWRPFLTSLLGVALLVIFFVEVHHDCFLYVEAVFGLIENDGVGAVDGFGGDFFSAVGGQVVHDEGAWRVGEQLGVDLIGQKNFFACGGFCFLAHAGPDVGVD